MMSSRSPAGGSPSSSGHAHSGQSVAKGAGGQGVHGVAGGQPRPDAIERLGLVEQVEGVWSQYSAAPEVLP